MNAPKAKFNLRHDPAGDAIAAAASGNLLTKLMCDTDAAQPTGFPGMMILRRILSRSAAQLAGVLAVLLLPAGGSYAAPAGGAAETVEQATCRVIEDAARTAKVPVGLLTRLVWTESRFRADAMSPKGAQGIAQFMPDTAAAHGLANPFDPEQAIPAAASLLVRLDRQFGNIGLAAAAYNAGSARVTAWLGGGAGLPVETQNYVLAVTRRTAQDWAAAGQAAGRGDGQADGLSCLAVTETLRTDEGSVSYPIAPWGVQLSGNFSKAVALSSFARARQRYAATLGQVQPMVIGTRMRSRGRLPFYRVMVPAASRAEADRVCRRILAGGGACVAVRTI
jgi:hypothetical protein